MTNKIIAILAVFSFLLMPTLGLKRAEAAPITFLNLKSVDVMKYTKDTMTNQPSDADIANLVSTLKSTGATHIALSIPMDRSTDYPAGSAPYPRDAYQLTQKWADTVHNAGLSVIWRGTWSGIEGIYGFPKKVGAARFPAGTAASAPTDGESTWLGKTYQYVVTNPGFFRDGDIWASLPERTEGIFSDSTSFLPYDGAGIQTNFLNFSIDLKKIADSAFTRIGKKVITGMTANNYTEVKSGWLPQSLFDTDGVVSIDYYGNTHTASEMDSDLRAMAASRGKPVFLQEWGDYWNAGMSQADRTSYLNSIYAVLQKLATDGVLAGFNYWGGWDNDAEGLLTRDATGFHLNYRGQLLQSFFGSAPAPAPVPPPAPVPAPSPSLTCPAPAMGSFTGCYYTDQNFSQLGLVRNDPVINFDWGSGSPDSAMPADNFTARWEGQYNLSGGKYTFSITADDGVRLYIDGQLLINQWKDQPATTYRASKRLLSGSHRIKVEYYEKAGGAVAKLSWVRN